MNAGNVCAALRIVGQRAQYPKFGGGV
jgi:hypothetical protein